MMSSPNNVADTDLDLDAILNAEQSFFASGYTDGYEHGRIHGLIEGRALGREKGFEMWEEVGYYEGFATVSRGLVMGVGAGNDKDKEKILNQIAHLLNLTAQIPKVNPSNTNDTDDGNGVDILHLLRQIRSRYKALCALLGVKPGRGVDLTDLPATTGESVALPSTAKGGIKRVGAKKKIWDARPAPENMEY